MAQEWSNFAFSQLASPIAAGDTTLTLQAGTGSLFPNPGVGDYFYLTVNFWDTATQVTLNEIMTCTARSGDVCTVLRAQQSTTAYPYPAGTAISLYWTAADFAGGGGGGSVTGSFPIVVIGTNVSLDPSAEELFQSVAFTHSTTSPLVLQAVAPPQFVTRALVVITTPFNDPTATISVGTTTTPGLVLQTTDISTLHDNQYESDTLVLFPIPDYLQLVLSRGSSTSGAGKLYYWYRNS